MNKRIMNQNGLKPYKTTGALARSSFALAGSSALALILISGYAQAQTIIANGQTVTTKQTIADGQVLTVETGGKISTTGAGAVEDDGSGKTVTVNNAGTIEAIGFGTKSIDTNGSTLILNNSGTISGEDYGIHTDILVNSINSGTISGGRYGISGETFTNFTNSGVIKGSQYGVTASGILTNFINSGTISGGASGINYGIYADSGTIINSGTISGYRAITLNESNSSSHITNSGTLRTIKGPAGTAVYFFGTNRTDTLSLDPGSILIGNVRWDGINDTLNMGPGLNAIVNFDTSAGYSTPDATNFSSPLNASGANYRAQSDASSIAAMTTLLDDVAGGIGGIVRTRMDTAFLPLEQGDATFSATKTAWTSGWGAYSSIDGTSSTATTTHNSVGGLFGVDWSAPDGPLYGFYGGAGVSQLNVSVKSGDKTSANNYYGGVYGLWDMHAGTYGLNITGGVINFDSNRTIADSSLATGFSTAQADYKGWFIAPTLSYSKERQMGEKILISTFSVGYQGLFTEGYSETGSNANVSVNARNIHQVTARGEFALQQEKVLSSGTVLNFAPFMGAEGHIGVGSNNVTASLLGNTATFNPGGDKATGRGFVGAKFTAAMSNTKSLFGKVEGSWDSSNTKTIAGNIGFAVKF